MDPAPKPELVFEPGVTPNGFTRGDLSEKIGDSDTIVRELLQNSLHASMVKGDERESEVILSIQDRPLGELPGLAKYREVFGSARSLRQKISNEQSNSDKTVISRIESVLFGDTVRVLFCRDNGIGVDQRRMTNLLSEGLNETNTGPGSQGVGHITAFSASDLRYVLYAGRYRDDVGYGTIAGGQAILAAHVYDSKNFGGQGFWRRPDADLFDRDRENFPTEIPELFTDHLPSGEETGTVVAITGFDCFRMGNGDLDAVQEAVDEIARIAALNFLVAIWQGAMSVRIQAPSQTDAWVDKKSVSELLRDPEGHRSSTDHLDGMQAARTYTTLERGEQVSLPALDGVDVRFRSLADEPGARSRVQVFRDGMWITNGPPKLQRIPGKIKPFDAVVMLSNGKLYDLVRKSEGPQHRKIETTRLDMTEKRGLDRMFQDIQRALFERAGEYDGTKFTPPDWARVTGEEVRDSQPVKPRRPRVRVNGGGGGGGRGDGTASSPRAGLGFEVRSRLLVGSSDPSGVRSLRGKIRVEGEIGQTKKLGLRVYVESGSDDSCEQPLSPRWLRLSKIQTRKSVLPAVDDDPYEVRIPPESTEFELILSDIIPVEDVQLLRIDTVRR